ncbi:mucin-7-like [Cajanus cajan]|uniref:mucin-7-like n=1 Tax=Cajanus cajan TaxID=3821 RepID=UPI00098DA805|nr:mucin-7-like [Cajanus cajan]
MFCIGLAYDRCRNENLILPLSLFSNVNPAASSHSQSLSPIHQTLNLMLSSSLAPDVATADIVVRALRLPNTTISYEPSSTAPATKTSVKVEPCMLLSAEPVPSPPPTLANTLLASTPSSATSPKPPSCSTPSPTKTPSHGTHSSTPSPSNNPTPPLYTPCASSAA